MKDSHCGGIFLVMGEVSEDVDDPVSGHGVETGGRFVEEEAVRLSNKLQTDGNPCRTKPRLTED